MLVPRAARRLAGLTSLTALVLSSATLSLPSYAAGSDRDHDGMPNRWETRHGLDPRTPNARGDKDHDGLRNLAEYRHHSLPEDEDTDNDGHDDGDEVNDDSARTKLLDRDSDDDGTRDGDEDLDRDGVDNEDEDDATESCRSDDDDRDSDGLDDEDENELGGRAGDSDSDDDGTLDGDEDEDEDGEADEDEDDSDSDSCGRSDEDEGDELGTIVSFDDVTGDLVIATHTLGEVTFVVTPETEIELDSSGRGSGEEVDASYLVPGQGVAEVDLVEDDSDDDPDDSDDDSSDDSADGSTTDPVVAADKLLEEIELTRS